jgi:hypothetical protein
MSETDDTVPPSVPPKEDKRKKVVATAKGLAIPSSIVGAIVTAITAMVQANDTSVEKRTYDTLVVMVQDDRESIRALQRHIDALEQALIASALRPNTVAVPTPEPEPGAEAEPAATEAAQAPSRRPRHGRSAGAGFAAADPLDSLTEPEAVPTAEQIENAMDIAFSLGRKITQDGQKIEVEPEAAPAPEAPPEFDELELKE